jgi:hypothetical protein
MKKLILRLTGGLGNQLFAFATARRIAHKNGAELILDTETGFQYDHIYKRSYQLGFFSIQARSASAFERLEPIGRVRRLILRKYSEFFPLLERRYIKQSALVFEPMLLNLHLKHRTTHFESYGQSENYFADIREILIDELKMNIYLDTKGSAYEEIIKSSCSVALHVRWFDKIIKTNPANLPMEYYKRAVDSIIKKTPQVHFFIFSDDLTATNNHLASLLFGLPHTVVDMSHTEYPSIYEFALMRQCKQWIISNSTFSWWAAWLGETKDQGKQVICPAVQIEASENITAWGFPMLIPERWEKL